MTHRDRRPPPREVRLVGKPPEDPRYEIVFERPSAGGGLWDFVPKLGSLTGRIGEIVGEVYARATKLVLAGVERFEDDAAERRFRRRRRSRGARVRASLPGATQPSLAVRKVRAQQP